MSSFHWILSIGFLLERHTADPIFGGLKSRNCGTATHNAPTQPHTHTHTHTQPHTHTEKIATVGEPSTTVLLPLEDASGRR
jgi:hypothetical protein